MSYEHLYGLSDQREQIPYLERFESRDRSLKRLRELPVSDIVVVGGGIHGTAFAHLAALNGFRTVLLERNDYASATSGRSSRMIHGGLRYVELFDFAQVLEGVRAREDLFTIAGHIVRPQEFLFPVSSLAKRIQVAAGLTLYDWVVRVREHRHRWISAVRLGELAPLSTEMNRGAFQYIDGLTSDARLVLEHLTAARQEGALCLNYLSLESFRVQGDGTVVGWHDRRTGEKGELRTGIIVNCSGPWVAEVGRVNPSPLAQQLVYSQGAHLLFQKPWTGPALIIPTTGKGGYYFVWPLGDLTLVGTTERPVKSPEWDPLPTTEEVEELLSRVARDIPNAGLSRKNLVYGYAGIRTLPLSNWRSTGSTTTLSRKHRWAYSEGMLSLLGGKLTTHAWTVREGLEQIYRLGRKKPEVSGLKGRLLPGAIGLANAAEQFRTDTKRIGLDPTLVEQTIGRLGGRVRYLGESADGLTAVGGQVLRGEIEMAIRVEQAETIEDLMTRRLGLEWTADQGLAALPEIARVFAELKPGIDVMEQVAAYKEKVRRTRLALGLVKE